MKGYNGNSGQQNCSVELRMQGNKANFEQQMNSRGNYKQTSGNTGHQEYNANPSQQSYNGNLGQQRHSANTAQQEYNTNSGQHGYNDNNGLQNYNTNPGQQRYNGNLVQQRYNGNQEQQRYSTNPGQQRYNDNLGQQDYNTNPGLQGMFGQQGFGGNTGQQRFNENFGLQVNSGQQRNPQNQGSFRLQEGSNHPVPAGGRFPGNVETGGRNVPAMGERTPLCTQELNSAMAVHSQQPSEEKGTKHKGDIRSKFSKLRTLTGRVKRVKEWISYGLSFPVLFVVHGRLLAAVQSIGTGRAGRSRVVTRKTFVLVDLEDSAQKIRCVFYEIDRRLELLDSGARVKVTGKCHEDGSILAFSVDTVDPGTTDRFLPRSSALSFFF